MANTFKKDYSIELYPKYPAQVPVRESIENVEARMLEDANADIGTLKQQVGDYDSSMFNNKSMAGVLETQGYNQKLAAIENRIDDIHEVLNNKIINLPIINDTGATRAYFDISLADTTDKLRLTCLEPGSAGNGITITITAQTEPNQSTVITWISPNLNISLGTDQEGVANTKCYPLYRDLIRTPGITDAFIIGYNEADQEMLVLPTNGTEYFAHGIDIIAALRSTSVELDATVDAAAKIQTANVPDIPVAASAILTLGEAVNEGALITVGLTAYKMRLDALGAGVKASNTLTITGNPDEGSYVKIGYNIYHFRRDPLSADGVKATAVLTSDGTEISDGDTVTIGTGANARVYRFKDTPVQAYDVKRDGTTADTTLGNLVKAVNASGIGDGTDYYAGTLAHPNVIAGEVAAHAITFTAKIPGVPGNTIAKSLSAAHLDWDGEGALFTGGIDPAEANDVYTGGDQANAATHLIEAITHDDGLGTNEGTHYWGFATNLLATAETGGAGVVTVTAILLGFIGNSVESIEGGDTSEVLAWTHADHLVGGIDAEAAGDVFAGANAEATIDNLLAAINLNGVEGTNYGTGTIENALCFADKLSASTLKVIAKTAGSAGNSIGIGETLTSASNYWGTQKTPAVVLLSGGLGASGVIGQLIYTITDMYLNVSTTAGTPNWKRIPLCRPEILVVNDDNAAVALDLEAVSQTVVLVNNNGKGLNLPAATGSGIEIRISNKNAAALTVTADGDDVIDADSAISLAQYAAAILVDYAAGFWAAF